MAKAIEIQELLRIAFNRAASDLHLVVPNPPILRIDGKIIVLTEFPILTPDVTASVFQSLASQEQQQRFKREQELDFSIDVSGLCRFRVNASYQRDSISLVFRLIPLRVPTFEELGLPEICKALALMPRGLVLVTGPTGSGKSSTLAAMLNYLNDADEKKIVTIEDPIEFIFPTGKCIISQRELGTDTKSFINAVEHVLRQDPNVIMIGEMRDLPTMAAALTAAETGHLVLSTLHTRGAAQSISRVIDVFPAAQQQLIRLQLANVLQAVISQALLRRSDGRGRVAAFEVMIGNTAIRNLIREDKLNQLPTFIEAGREEGMFLLSQDLDRLLIQGIISPEEAMTIAPGVRDAEAKAKSLLYAKTAGKDKLVRPVREKLPVGKEPVPASNGEVAPQIDMTVDELLATYDVGSAAADAKFRDKILRVKGVIDKLEIEYTLGIFNILLVGNSNSGVGRVRCVFPHGHGADLKRVRKGQSVTIQGKYVGSLVDFRLTDCFLIE